MALTKITKADLDAAIKKLTTSDATVWWKVLATTDEGTDLCFVVGWEYYDDEDDRFYQDKGYTICAKIGYKPHNLMVMDYDDIYMPFDKKTGDVWDTDSAVDKDPSCWDMLVRNYNSEASAIWRKYGKPNRDGMTALDLMESKKKEAKKHTCSMQKKKESLTKMQEMHPMFKNWNPRNQAQVNNTLRLAMAECPQDMPELIKIVKAKGFDVPSGLTPATGWGSFESRSKRQYKECSMSKKKESLAKKSESSFDELRVSDEDVAIVIHDIDRFDDRFDDSMIPGDGEEFTLPEFRQLIGDLAETSNGYASVSRDGSDIRVAIEVPLENDDGELTDQYREELVLRGTARIRYASLEHVADYLNDYLDHR